MQEPGCGLSDVLKNAKFIARKRAPTEVGRARKRPCENVRGLLDR